MYSEIFLENLRQCIYVKRTDKEKEIRSQSFISLSDEGQKMSLELEEREKHYFAKGLGFEIGGLVKNKNNQIFYVNYISDMGGMLWIKDISITLVKGCYCNSLEDLKKSFSIYDRGVVKTRPLYHIEEHQYMDLYEPVVLETKQLSLFDS